MVNFTSPFEARQLSDLDFIKTLHRGTGATVAFMAPDTQGKLRKLGACAVDELDSHADLIKAHQNGELYFTLNSIAAGNGTLANGLQYALTKDRDTRYLNVVWVDLDIGRTEATGPASMSVAEALQAIVDAITEGIIPQPSATIKSGRGVWALWLLHDRDNHQQPPRAHDSNQARHRAICTELAARLEHLNPDLNSINVARVTRVPGSMNCKSGQRVEWDLLTDEHGETFTYSLDELTEFLNCKSSKVVKNRTVRFFGRAIKSRGSAPARRHGCEARARYRANDIEKLSAARGGFKEGQRWHALTVYAHQLKLSGADVQEMTAKVEQLAAACKPAFPSSHSDGTTAQIVSDAATGTLNFGAAQIVKRLKVTATEARRLELRSILPASVRDEQTAATRAASRTGQRESRLQALRAIVEANPTASASEYQAELIGQGITASSATVKRELNAIAPNRTPRPAGRPTEPKTAQRATPPSISKRFEPIKLAPDAIGVNIDVFPAQQRSLHLGRGKAPAALRSDGPPSRSNPPVVIVPSIGTLLSGAAYTGANSDPPAT